MQRDVGWDNGCGCRAGNWSSPQAPDSVCTPPLTNQARSCKVYFSDSLTGISQVLKYFSDFFLIYIALILCLNYIDQFLVFSPGPWFCRLPNWPGQTLSGVFLWFWNLYFQFLVLSPCPRFCLFRPLDQAGFLDLIQISGNYQPHVITRKSTLLQVLQGDILGVIVWLWACFLVLTERQGEEVLSQLPNQF